MNETRRNYMMNDEIFMKEAIRLSQLAVSHGNEPFGAVPLRIRTAPAFLRRDAYHGFTRIYTLFQL